MEEIGTHFVEVARDITTDSYFPELGVKCIDVTVEVIGSTIGNNLDAGYKYILMA